MSGRPALRHMGVMTPGFTHLDRAQLRANHSAKSLRHLARELSRFGAARGVDLSGFVFDIESDADNLVLLSEDLEAEERILNHLAREPMAGPGGAV